MHTFYNRFIMIKKSANNIEFSETTSTHQRLGKFLKDVSIN